MQMKLLDLKTGKYPKLGRDWLYGGNFIVTNNLPSGGGSDFDKHYESEPQEPLKTLCKKTGTVVYGKRYVLLQFSNNKTVGDIIKHNPKRTQFDQLPKIYHTNKEVNEVLYKHDILCEEMGYSSEYVDPDYHCEITGNIFGEYSKQLRNEPNNFEESLELIKLVINNN